MSYEMSDSSHVQCLKALLCMYLAADCDAEADDEDGDGQLVKDSEGAEDVPEDLLVEEALHQHGQDAQHVHHVQHGDRHDDGGHEGLQIMTLPTTRRRGK